MTPRRAPQRAEILLVEDNPGDQYLALEVFKGMPWAKKPHVVGDGNEALAFLRHEGKFRKSPRPDLILLDLNLPGIDGHDVLRAVKGDPELKRIPVVVFTCSDLGADVAKSYELGAACHFTKPHCLDAFMLTLRNIERYWRGAHANNRGPWRALTRKWRRFQRRASNVTMTQQEKAHFYWMLTILWLFGVLLVVL